MASTEADDVGPEWTHLLVETSLLDEVKGPLRGSARLKYTCLSVSRKYLALGSNTGSVYIFSRVSLKHLQVVFPEVEPAMVNIVSLCPNDKVVAFSTINGHVVTMELNIEKRQKPERLRLITDHLKCNVTSLQWDSVGSKLYVGDNTGRVTVSMIPNSKMKNLVVLPVEVIMKLESSVVQLDWCSDKLLVSTLNRAYLCNTAKQNFSQIGKKPRDGEYGGCFLQPRKTSSPLIYCARPSSRMWEVDFDGNVLNTHQFRHLLAIPSLQIINTRSEIWKSPEEKEYSVQGINFPKFRVINDRFLLTWKKDKLYIFDPLNVKVILWCEGITGLYDVRCHGNDAYLFFEDGNVRCVHLLSINSLISFLVSKNKLILTTNILIYFMKSILKTKWQKHLKLTVLNDLYVQLLKIDQPDLADKVKSILPDFQVLYSEYLSDTDGSESGRSRSGSGASVISSESRTSQISEEKKFFEKSDTEDGRSHDSVVISEKTDEETNKRNKNDIDSVVISGETGEETTKRNNNDVINNGISSCNQSEDARTKRVIFSGQMDEIVQVGDRIDINTRSDAYADECRTDGIGIKNEQIFVKTDDIVISGKKSVDVENERTVSEGIEVLQNGENLELNHQKVESKTEDIECNRSNLDKKSVNPLENSYVEECLDGERSFPDVNVNRSSESVSLIEDDGKLEQVFNIKDVSNRLSSEKNDCNNEPMTQLDKMMEVNNVDIYTDDIFSDSTDMVNKVVITQDTTTSSNSNLSVQEQDPEPLIVKKITTSEKDLTSKPKKKKQKVVNVDIFSPGEEKSKKKKHGKPSGVTRRLSTGSEKNSQQHDFSKLMSLNDSKEENTDIKTESINVSSEVNQQQDNVKKSSSVPNDIHSGSQMIKVQSESDLKLEKSGSLPYEPEFDSRSTDGIIFDARSNTSSSLGSSPSHSPLSTSVDSTGSDMFNRKSLSSVKDSIQSKFSSTKKLFIKTIKESQKNLLSKSLPKEDTGQKCVDQNFDNKNRKDLKASQDQLQKVDHREITIKAPDPIVDISDFVKVTEDTHKKFQDLSVLCDKNKLTLTLTTWVIALNRILQKLHTRRYRELLKQQHQVKCPYKAGNKQELTPVCQNDSNVALTNETEERSDIVRQSTSSVKDGFDLVEQSHEGVDQEQIDTSDMRNTQISDDFHTRDISNEQNRGDNLKTKQVLSAVTLNPVSSCGKDQHENGCINCDQNKTTSMKLSLTDNSLSSMDYNIFEQIYVTDPFFLPTEIYASAASLANICFSSCCYGDISEYLRPDLGSIQSCDICDKCVMNGINFDSTFGTDVEKDMCDINCQHMVASEHLKMSLTAYNSFENKPSHRNSNDNLDSVGTNVSMYNKSEQKLHNMTLDECLHSKENVVRTDYPDHKDLCQSNLDNPPILSNLCQSVGDVDPHLPKNDSLSISSDQSQSSTAAECSISSDKSHLSKENTPTHQFLSNQHCHQLPFAPPPLPDRCLFVQSYFHLLDIQKLRDILYSEKKDCSDLWSTLIRCQQELCSSDMLSEKLNNKEINSAVDILSSRDYPPQRIMGYISKLFLLSPSRTTDICINCNSVNPLDVLYLCMFYNKPEQQYFYKFMYSRVSSALLDKRREWNFELYGNQNVLTKWLELLLSNQKFDQRMFIQEGMPRPWSHKIEWKHTEMTNHVIHIGVNECSQKILDICKSQGYWCGCLKILKILGRYDEMTEYILQLGDVQLLNRKINHGFLPSSNEEWRKLIRHFCDFNVRSSQKIQTEIERSSKLPFENKSESQDLSTENSMESHVELISWKEMSQLMLCHLGTVETITILQECDISDNCLPVDFFQTAIFSAFINRQQRNLTHNLLEKLDAYLWTQKSNCLMPQLQYAASKEKQSKNSPIKTQDTLSLVSSLSGMSATSSRYMEDTECHWGVKTKLVSFIEDVHLVSHCGTSNEHNIFHRARNYTLLPHRLKRYDRNCRCCNLPLTETVSHVEPGILVFDCRASVTERYSAQADRPGHHTSPDNTKGELFLRQRSLFP